MSYILESAAERREREKKDIKNLFQHLVIDEKMSYMEAYEEVGYKFYKQADAIRKIIASKNRSGKNSHNNLNK